MTEAELTEGTSTGSAASAGAPPVPAAPVPAPPLPGSATTVSSPQPVGEQNQPVGEQKVMSFVDHLSELRRRLFIVVLAVVVGSAVGFWKAKELVALLKAPLGDRPLYFTAPGDAFLIEIKLAFAAGIVLAMPVILYQAWRFISPGLTPGERRAARPWIPVAVLFFVLGVGLAEFVLPFAIRYLFSFTSPDLQPLISADRYFDFASTLFLAFGLVLEFPVVLVLLSKIGVVTSGRLSRIRRYVAVAITVFAGLITPGGDLVSPIILGVVLYGLFEGTILFIRLNGK